MTVIPLVPAIFILPFYQWMKDHNLKVTQHSDYIEKLLNPDVFESGMQMSAVAVRDLMNQIAGRRERFIGFDIGLNYSLQSLPSLVAKLGDMSFYEFIDAFCHEVNRQFYLPAYWLDVNESGIWLCRQRVVDISRSNVVIEQYTLGLMIALVRLYQVNDWTPEKIHLQRSGYFKLPAYLGNSQIYIGQQDSRILLSADIPIGFTATELSEFKQKPIDTFKQQVVDVLAPFIGGKMPKINEYADIVGLSVRSLQRLFTENNEKYRNVCLKLTMQYASNSIAYRNVKISTLSRQLGYSEPAHFNYAFKKIYGVAPLAYRQAYNARLNKN